LNIDTVAPNLKNGYNNGDKSANNNKYLVIILPCKFEFQSIRKLDDSEY
jgi:hypothetical protein